MKKLFWTAVVWTVVCFSAQAQRVAVKTNLLYDALTTLQLGAEAAWNTHWSAEAAATWNPWSPASGKSLQHVSVQPEIRYWLREAFNGHYFGLHLHYADYDIAGKKLPFDMKKEFCYDGFAYGGGISYGYQLYLSPRWNLEFTIGAGYTCFEYDKYYFPKADEADWIGKYRNQYWGLTKAGVSIVYLIR